MAKIARKRKQRDHASDSDSRQTAALENPFIASTNDKNKRKPTSKIFSSTGIGWTPDPRLISDLRKIATSPPSKAASAAARESPSYKASQRAKMKQGRDSQTSPIVLQSPLIDSDDGLDNIRDFGNRNQTQQMRREPAAQMNSLSKPVKDTIKEESDSDSGTDSESESHSDASSSSSEGQESDTPTMILPAIQRPLNFSSTKINNLHGDSLSDHSNRKRTLSSILASSSSSEPPTDNDSSNDNDASTTQPKVKRLKPNPTLEAKSSTVASRNPLPPELLNGTIKPRPATHALDINESSSNETKPTINHTKYPPEVLSAAHSLETVLPPYLTTAKVSDTGNRLDTDPLRPAAGSDDTTRLVTILNSAMKLIVHLSMKKLNESETDLQTQVLRITKDREQTLMVMQAEVRRLLAKNGQGRR